MRESKIDCIIFDLDGTLADVSKRRELAIKAESQITGAMAEAPFFAGRKAWWDIWQNPQIILDFDEPNEPVVLLYRLLRGQLTQKPEDDFTFDKKFKMIVTSARNDKNKDITEQWFKKHDIPFDTLIMRPDGDFRPDREFKQEILNGLKETHNIIMTFDDRNQVVEMWRDNNIPCLQVADGNF